MRKRLTALLLSITMVFSMVADILPAAYAAGESDSASSTNWDFGDNTATGRPRLFVDFLGDNNQYKATTGEALDGDKLVSPGLEDLSNITNPGKGHAWEGYREADTKDGETIFWVGVGVDKMKVLDLFEKDDRGIYSLELGFYYDSTIVEPYAGADGNYLQMMQKANLENYAHKWGNEYHIVAAETGLEPQIDVVTQETLSRPSVDQIVHNTIPNYGNADWKMTYVSLEKNEGAAGLNRFHGENQTGTKEETQYLLLIPFRLKGYAGTYDRHNVGEQNFNVCLRLVRNASLFSIGGGTDGVEPYGAWERVTTRNPGHDLKLMTEFQGDLDIFGGGKYLEKPYHANLLIEGTYYGTGNEAELYITNDPSPNKGRVNTPGSQITGLYDGTSLSLDVTCQTMYNVKVWAAPQGEPESEAWQIPLSKVVENDILSHYSFIMPKGDVDVHVVFSLDPDVTDFWLYLDEEQEADDQGRTITGNSTEITATYTDTTVTPPDVTKTTVNKDSPTDNFLSLPAEKVHMGAEVEVEVKVHHDYEAYVDVINVQTGRRIELESLPADYIPDTDTLLDNDRHLAVTLPTGGTFKVKGGMPQSDMEVRVTYRPANRYKAILEVWHDNGVKISSDNVAQLESTVYKENDEPMPAYSGVVYQDIKGTPDDRSDDDHRAVEGTFRVLEQVDASSAVLSGSLGGDGRQPIAWNSDGKSMMAVLWDVVSRSVSATAPTTAADLAGGIASLDLRGQAVMNSGGTGYTGLRKNNKGEFYTDGNINLLYNRLFTLGQMAQAAGLQMNGSEPDDPTQTYTYFALTPAQVQMYLLDCETAKDPSTVTLRTDADAAAELAKSEYDWFEPSAGTVPPTANTTPYLEVRGGRRMVVTVEADSAYTTLNTVKLLDPDRNLLATVQPQRDTNYQNVYYFDMPNLDVLMANLDPADRECIVEVTFAERPVHRLDLKVNGDDGEADNVTTVTAYTPNPGNKVPKTESINKDGEHIDNVLDGSVVTVDVKVAEGYEVWVDVVRGPGQQNVFSLPTTDKDSSFTFVMPSEDAEVQVNYRQTDKKRNNANVVLQYYPGSAPDSSNQAYWDGTSPHSTKKASVEGEDLTANILVAKNYYIYAVRTYTTDTSEVSPGPYVGAGYPFLLSGNGWNNGQGGNVTIDTVMPDSEYWVEVILREGPPVAETDQSLTLLVVDDDNSDTSPVDNWAQATAMGSVTLGPVGKARPGGIYATDFVKAGEMVEVEFHPAAGYYVDKVEVQPAALGVAVSWLSDTKAEFYMPAGSAAVVVTFKKDTGNPDDRTKLFLDLAKTEQGTTAEPTSKDNTILSFKSPTTALNTGLPGGVYYLPADNPLPGRYPAGGTATTGAAQPGETVTLNIDVAEGWYIHSLTVNGSDGRLPYTLSGNGYSTSGKGSAVATFVMPHSDASVVVNYRKGEPPAKKTEYAMELRVADPQNVGPAFADNWALAAIRGQAPERTLGPVGKGAQGGGVLWDMEYAYEGERVAIRYSADAGYALDIIIVTSTGVLVPVTYVGGGVAEFTMPAGDVTALVRFKEGEANQYTANLVLHMPAGVSVDDYDMVGEGSFDVNLNGVQYDLTNKLYSMTAEPGQRIDAELWAKDGYYIKKVVVTPVALDVTASLSGAFGRQDSSLVMPAANIQVNVYFEKGWPDTVQEYPDTVNYDLVLEVYDNTGSGSTANFEAIGGDTLASPENDPVGHNGRKVLPNSVYDDETVEVALHPGTDCYAKSITVTDSRGASIPWRYVPGGIAFEATPAHVTVVVEYAKLPKYDPDDPDDPNRPEMKKVTLHIQGASGNDSASVTDGGSNTITADGTSFTLPVPPAGQTLTLEAAPDTGHSIAAVYAVSGGKQLLLPMPLVPGGGSVQFAMQPDDVDVYVIFDDTMAPPEDTQRLGTLVVAGPVGSGSARMTAKTGAKTDTGTVNAAGAGSLFAPQDTLLTVDLTVNTGYSIAAIRVTDGQGNRIPYTWTDGSQRQFTLSMPAAGARVYVEYVDVSKITQALTAQVVVNNGGNAGNTAKLRLGTTALGGGVAYLNPVHVGDEIYLDLVAQPGFEVEYIKVVPVKYGIAPSLYKPANERQTTFFTMPGEDVVIYVRFKEDTRTRRPVTLVVEGDSTVGNQAYIHSNYSGKKGPVTPGNNDSVWAAPATATLPAEWVTVDYEWADGCSVASITVVDAGGNPVPFNQHLNDPNRKGKLDFPMVDSDVTVTIVYKNDPNPPTYDAVLHVIDLDNPAASNASWGKLTWNGTDTGEIHSFTQSTVNPTLGPGEEILKVPTGEMVTVDADAEAGTYIKAAYVLYRDKGQMLWFDFDLPTGGTIGFTGHQQDTFQMHPGRVDVYIYFTKTEPVTNDYAAVLMLDSPSTDTTSTATITNDDVRPTQIGTDTVTANDPNKDHGYVTATDGDTITVTVNPATGYVIDSVLMTPLGISSDAGGTVVLKKMPDGSYQFTMPAQNVAVRVKLRRGSSGEFRATLHYRMWNGDPVADPTKDWAMLSFADDANPARWDKDGEFRMVPELAVMTLGVSMDDPDLVLSAYVLQENGAMVPLTGPTLEGTVEGNSITDDTLTDAETTFVMPAADVDVFVWFINKNDPDMPDVDKWHTAVLTVTDDDGAGNLNSGKNSATIESSVHNTQPTEVFSNGVVKRGTVTGNISMGDVAQHSFLWVEEGETVKVVVEKIDPDYDFVPPVTVTRSDSSGAVATTVDSTNRPHYIYTYPVETYNTAARAHFTATDQKESNLNVVIIDRDNPGNGTVRNQVHVTPGTLPDLTVVSTTSAGARQRVPGVQSSTRVDFEVTPASSEYSAVIRVLDSSGNVLSTHTYIDGFTMPGQDVTLEVTFFRGREVTLSVWDIRDSATSVVNVGSEAKLAESAFGGVITASSDRVPATFDYLIPDGTDLTASITKLQDDKTTRTIGALVIYANGSSQWLPATTVAGGADEYHYTVSGAPVEIRMVVGPIDSRDYLATVSPVNLPSGTPIPTIENTTTTTTYGSWTTAEPGHDVKVSFEVPYGYKAVVTSGDVTLDGEPIEVYGPTNESDANVSGTATFTMPSNNVHVTVRYVATRFKATITVAGNGRGTATLQAGSRTVTATGTIANLVGGEPLVYTATPAAGSTITRIIMTTASGSTRILTHTGGVGSVAMPTEDVTITVIFSEQRTTTHYLDLHVSGTAGGEATLVAAKNGTTVGTLSSTPENPVGFSRIGAVESGSDVTVTIQPRDGYIATFGYYLHNGAALTYVPVPANISAGGQVTFTMPDTNTCIYVTFQKGENPPETDPDDPNDPKRYLDLHVNGTQGGTATLEGDGFGKLESTPTNPKSVGTLQPVIAGNNVTLTVKPEPGYTAMVSYYVYHDGTPEPVALQGIPSAGGTATFVMPNQSTCVYVTFRGPDRLPYLDLHVTNPRGGEAELITDGFGTLTSTPGNPQTYGHLDQVEAGTPVTLKVQPNTEYTVTVSYYLHSGGPLYYTSYLIDSGNGGEATFDMPGVNTCIYVTFNGPGDEPSPDPNDPNKYLDLHVSGTQGGTATLTADGFTPMTSTPDAPVSYDQRRPVTAGTPVSLEVKPEEGYTVVVSYYVHNGGTFGWVTNDVDKDAGGTATFTMPAQSTCIYVTFKRLDNPDPKDPNKYLDLHVTNTSGGSATLTAADVGTVQSTPAAPRAIGTLRPVPEGKLVTLDVTPEPGNIVTVSYTVHNGGSLTYKSYTIDSSAGGTATFDMPAQSTCVYVTFHKSGEPVDPPDPQSKHYLDLHVNGTAGGEATLVASKGGTTIGTGHSSPSAPAGLSRINAVEAGSDVTLTVKPGTNYIVTVSYSLHNGSVLSYNTNIDGKTGGTATFQMPDTNTCVYVTFRTAENPDPSDPNKYLDLHVSGTQGGVATLTADGVGTLQSTPTNPKSVSTLRPVSAGTGVTLTATPEPGYTVMVTYYVYNNGVPVPTTLTSVPSNGGTVTFQMPDQSTCVYVTFRGPDKLPRLDLYVTRPQGGEVSLATDGFGTLTSTPAAPQAYGRLDEVEAGTPVTLNVTPGIEYTVTVQYALQNGGPLYYTSYLIDSGNGGTATFDMPGVNTSIYVTFKGPGDDPDPNPDAKYLDLHVSGTQGGSASLVTSETTPRTLSSTPAAPMGYSSISPVEEGTTVTLTATPEPGYQMIISSYVHGTGGTLNFVPATTVTTDVDGTKTHTFTMPATSSCVYVTFKRLDNPDPDDPNKYLDLHVTNTSGGSATLTAADVGTVQSTPAFPRDVGTLRPVPKGNLVTLEVKPEPGNIVTVSYTVHNGGSLTYKSYTIDSSAGGTATFDMPDQSTCVYVTFHKSGDPPEPIPPDPEPELHIAFVTLVGTDGNPLNSAQSIVNTTQNLGGGTLWAYGEAGDTMLTSFTVAPGYTAVVTARRVDTGASIKVGQLGTTDSATATATMPSMPAADLEVIITYSKKPPEKKNKLTLRLVGHGGERNNNATLTGGEAPLTLFGSQAPSGADVTTFTMAAFGTRLDLDANRDNDYLFVRATLEYTDSSGLQVIDLALSEYLTNGTSLLFMPDADAIVTVYYRMPYQATLFVIDALGQDFENNSVGDTAGPNAPGVVPKTTLEVTNGATSVGRTTRTHTPITGLFGTEMVTTMVDKTTLPLNTSIASVIATTSAGTINLAEVGSSGVYRYAMATASRSADDVDVTVILRDELKPDPMYIATVYKVGHDNLPGNSATITNTTTGAVPTGTIWSGAYDTDAMTVDVTTAPGYYAVVTAVQTGTTIPVPVLQWTATGPFTAEFTMPAANVDVTVTYTTTPPSAFLALELVGHGQQTNNKADVNNQNSGTLIPTLQLNGAAAPDTNPVRKTSDSKVKAGTNLEVLAGIATGYHVESIVLVIQDSAGNLVFPEIPLTVSATNSAVTPMPVLADDWTATLRVTFAPGEKTPRPFDPEHSTIYYGPPVGNYPTDPDGDNPDLSAPTQEGWILADNLNSGETTKGTFVVAVPTLYDVAEQEDGSSKDTLYDAGEGDELTLPPIYTFYWKDDQGNYHKLTEGTDITVSNKHALAPVDNPKGSYPAGDTHYGYELTITALDGSASPLAEYLEEGGIIYVTATKQGKTDSGVDWSESDKTQVVIEPSKTYTATLHIVDTSSSLNNEVKLWVNEDADPHPKYGKADADGEKIEKLLGKETLRTTVKPDSQVKVVSVLAVPSKGSPEYLAVDTVDFDGDYPYPMPKDDVEIIVVLANEDDDLYTATVVKDDPSNDPGNTVEISNPTHPTLNRDWNDPARWTAAYPGDEIRVDVTAAPGYRAVVTAQTVAGVSLPVAPTAGGGTMVVTLPDKMPAANIEITVRFEKVDDPQKAWVTLQMRMDDTDRTLPVDPSNQTSATGTVGGAGLTLWAEAWNNYTDTQLLDAGTASLASVLAMGYRISDVVMSVNGGAEISLGAGATGFTFSGGDTVVVTVLLVEEKVDDCTPRPFDPAHSVKYPDATYPDGHTGPDGHQDGYLLAKNLGSSQIEITVPNLYDGDLYAAENVTYKLYAKIGGIMVPIVEGTDYDTVIPVASVGYTHPADGKTWTGQVFTIQSLNPASPLGDYVKNGGVIYITATGANKKESAYTEVILPADPQKGYTVTLKIIDDTLGTTHNAVRMQNANSWETVSWTTTGNPTDVAGSITGLLGGELIRTDVTVTAGEGVVYTVMAHTPSMGDVLLYAEPTGTIRYPKDMPTEDMDIIVHFRAEEEHIHIAAVEKRGATGVLTPPPGNDATISNLTDLADGKQDLKSGTIWTEGRCEKNPNGTADKIQVKVTTAEGFYATVTMSYMDPVNGLVEKTLVILGSGNPDPLLVEFDMPDADVQVVVFFEQGQKSPRPYDPKHSETYYIDQYQHYTDAAKTQRTPENQSTTDQEGWLLGENLGGGSALVTIPTLWGEKDGLEDATNAAFTFYLQEKDSNGDYTGNYILLEEGKDYILDHNPNYPGTDIMTPATEKYRYDTADLTLEKDFTGVTFLLLEKESTADHTSKLEGLLDSGLSLFVSATKLETAVPPWVEGEVTELVIPSTGLRPFDPDREDDPNYIDHWIRAENRGDYLIVTVPLLNSPNEDDPTSVDGKIHRFQLHLQIDGADRGSEIVNVTDLLKIENINGYWHPNIINTLYEENWAVGAPDPRYTYEEYYENEIYNDGYLAAECPPDVERWYGARFVVTIREDATGDNARILHTIFDNDGTMGDNEYRMYITSDVTETVNDDLPDFRPMDYVDFEVPRYYTLTGLLESYAPTHVTTVGLYPYLGTSDPDAGADGYAQSPAFVQRKWEEKGVGLWRTSFEIKSSELMGDDRSGVTYKALIEKAGHVFLEVPDVELTEDNLDPVIRDNPDPLIRNDLTFTLVASTLDENDVSHILYDANDETVGTVALFGGDVNGDGYARMEDYTYLMGYIGGRWGWNKNPYDLADRPEDRLTARDIESIYCEDALAYWADLDGDGYITVSDVAIWNSARNYNMNTGDYLPIMPQLRTDVTLGTAVSYALMTADELLLELEEELLPPEGEQLPPEEGVLPPEETLPDGEEPEEIEPGEEAHPGEGEEPELPVQPSDPEEETPEEPAEPIPTDPEEEEKPEEEEPTEPVEPGEPLPEEPSIEPKPEEPLPEETEDPDPAKPEELPEETLTPEGEGKAPIDPSPKEPAEGDTEPSEPVVDENISSKLEIPATFP